VPQGTRRGTAAILHARSARLVPRRTSCGIAAAAANLHQHDFCCSRAPISALPAGPVPRRSPA